MPNEWVEGWYRIKGKIGTTVGFYKGGPNLQLDNYLKTGAIVQRVHVVSDDELAEMIVDGVEAHLKYLDTGEFQI